MPKEECFHATVHEIILVLTSSSKCQEGIIIMLVEAYIIDRDCQLPELKEVTTFTTEGILTHHVDVTPIDHA